MTKIIPVFLAIAATSVHAQPVASANPIPVRALAPISASTVTPIRTILGGVKQLPGGKLLVNDPIARRLVLFDSTLKTFDVLRDSAPGAANSYGPRAAMVVPYLGDSSLFADMASQSLMVVDPAGAFTRVMAPPNPRDLGFLARPGAGVDAAGRLIYQGAQPVLPNPAVPGQTRIMQPRDSAPILRADFDTRMVDTIGRIKILAGDKRISTEAAGKVHTQVVVNPLQSIDEWTTLPDGSVAFVRGYDYHIDWLNADGTHSSSPKMPFDWRRLTDDDKQKLIDSARTARFARDSAAAARAAGGRGREALGVIRIEAGRDVAVAAISTTETVFVPLSEMPDYQPPIRTGAVRADLDGNVWILPTTTAQSRAGELVYDVVNRKGVLFERVRLPEGRSIAGFGRAGVVYLMWRDGANGWFIERTRVRR